MIVIMLMIMSQYLAMTITVILEIRGTMKMTGILITEVTVNDQDNEMSLR